MSCDCVTAWLTVSAGEGGRESELTGGWRLGRRPCNFVHRPSSVVRRPSSFIVLSSCLQMLSGRVRREVSVGCQVSGVSSMSG